MKVSGLNHYSNSPSFGRALKPDEMDKAYEAAQKARAAMGFKEGTGLLLVPAEKLPANNSPASLKEHFENFFNTAKKLLGINTVEVAGETDAAVKGALDEVLSSQGIRRIAGVEYQTENLEAVAEDLAKSYDGLRIKDAQRYTNEQLGVFENAFRKVKGESFDPKLLIYEVNDDGALFDWGASKIAGRYAEKVVVGSSDHLNDNGGVLWGSTSFFTNRMSAEQGSFIHGVRKAGQQTLAQQVRDPGQVDQSIHLLNEELKLHDEDIVHPARYAAAKRADVAMSQSFYKHFDDLTLGARTNVADFETAYFKALQSGEGDNYFDSLAKVMKAKGLNEGQNAGLYDEICKYRNALFSSSQNAPLTAKDALNLTSEQIEASYKDTANVVLRGAQDKIDLAAAIKQNEDKAKKIADELETLNPLNHKNSDKILSFMRKHKKALTFAGIAAGVITIGATLYSYGKEIGSKSQNGVPKAKKQG